MHRTRTLVSAKAWDHQVTLQAFFLYNGSSTLSGWKKKLYYFCIEVGYSDLSVRVVSDLLDSADSDLPVIVYSDLPVSLDWDLPVSVDSDLPVSVDSVVHFRIYPNTLEDVESYLNK